MVPICEICNKIIENGDSLYMSTNGSCYHADCYEASDENDCEDEDE